MKLGSFFDGSGGFPLAGEMCGIEPVWASEIEPYPVAVTKNRFPNMKHLGDISKINGAEIEPVDIITFGSPCQDLSVAGKRAGLKHEAHGDDETTRSGLFMEAVRIIKEMRDATNGKYPTFALWENVPGAFSSNRGEDFRIVCEELIKIVEPCAVMPAVPKKGWAYADSYCGDGWSLAYRVFDAQYWGVPQRRRRIHLVLDLGGECARKVLFEREGVRGDFTPCGAERETAPGYAENCFGTADREGTPYLLKIRSGCEGGGKGALVSKDRAMTLKNNDDQRLFQPVPNILLDDQGDQQINVRTDDKSPTLRAEMHGNVPCVEESAVCYRQGGFGDYVEDEVGTVRASGGDLGGGSENIIIEQPQYIVRRLTPTECARLQGFPDWWGHFPEKNDFTDEEYLFWLGVRNTHAEINGKAVKEYTKEQMLTWYKKLHTDSAEYKMWGNGIALPPAIYCMQGMVEVLNERVMR